MLDDISEQTTVYSTEQIYKNGLSDGKYRIVSGMLAQASN